MSFRSLFIAALSLLIFAIGCEKTTDPENTPPVIASVNISLPAANFSDTCNGPAYSYASLVQEMVTLAQMYSQFPGATYKDGAWTWTLPSTDGIAVILTARKLSDGSYEWRLILNGTDGTDTYTNWTAFLATTSADGKSGTLQFYDDTPTPSTVVEARMSWSTGANNVVTCEYESVADEMKFVLVTNGVTGEVTTYTKVGSAWVATGYHATWSTPGALATC